MNNPDRWQDCFRRCLVMLFCVIAITVVVVPWARCAQNRVEFRLVLSEKELEGKDFDVVKNGRDSLYIWRLHYLSDRDLDGVDIMQSASRANVFMLAIKFNKDGRKRLYRFTKKFAKKRVAIFAEGKLVTAALVWAPHFMGDRVVTRWPGTRKDLLAFAGKVNKANPSVFSLYVEEQGSYNDTAAEEWARYYAELNGYIEEKRQLFSEDARRVEADRDF